MNTNTFEDRQVQAAKGLSILFETLMKVCPQLKREFKMRERDEEHIDFDIDRYPFSVTWGDTAEPCIGGMRWVVVYSLCIWHTAYGGRNHPPETIDTTLCDSKSIHDCIRVALETVAKDEIRGVLENDGYERMAAEEKNLESY